MYIPIAHRAALPERMRPVHPTPRKRRGTMMRFDRQRGPRELATWLEGLVPSLTERWTEEIRRRGHVGERRLTPVLERFTELLVRLLPLMVGPHRALVAPFWIRTSELYGAIAAKRGLAAGEAIEELHLLRELVIRDLYRSPPAGGTVRLSLREILRMNRALDLAVTHGSVGHTDSLFFEFFEGDQTTALLRGGDVAAEAEQQLRQIEAELRENLQHRVEFGEASR